MQQRTDHDGVVAYGFSGGAVVVAKHVPGIGREVPKNETVEAIVRGIARDLPQALVTGQGPHIGTALYNELKAVVDEFTDAVSGSRGTVVHSRAYFFDLSYRPSPGSGQAPGAIRVEMFNGFAAPTFLAFDGAQPPPQPGRDARRVGSWLVLVTTERDASTTSAAGDVMDSIAEVLSKSE